MIVNTLPVKYIIHPSDLSRFCLYCHFLSVKQLIVQLDLSSSWTFGVKWSPSGNTLAYVGKKILSSYWFYTSWSYGFHLYVSFSCFYF